MAPSTLTVCLLPGGDRFEDFFDKIGVSLDTFREEFTGGWLFNYVKALRLAEVNTVLIYMSARVDAAVRFIHADTDTPVWILPSPWLHRKARNAERRFSRTPDALAAAASYLATPLRTLARVLRHERCDAILTQEYEYARYDICVLLGHLLGVPVFATFQGGSDTRTSIERPIRRISVRRCAGLIIPSAVESARVKAVYRVPEEKIQAIPNPVELIDSQSAIRHETRRSLGIGGSTVVVAWHGRVQMQTKGLDVLLDAWDQIRREEPDKDVRLLLVGSGRDAEALRQRLTRSDRVLWIDRYIYDRAKLWSYLVAADFYVIPSRREGFAVAALEAMASRLPIIASDAPGVCEVIPRVEADGGIVVPKEDVPALAVAIHRLLSEPDLRRRLADAARDRIEREFSLEVIGPRLRRFLFPSVGY